LRACIVTIIHERKSAPKQQWGVGEQRVEGRMYLAFFFQLGAMRPKLTLKLSDPFIFRGRGGGEGGLDINDRTTFHQIRFMSHANLKNSNFFMVQGLTALTALTAPAPSAPTKIAASWWGRRTLSLIHQILVIYIIIGKAHGQIIPTAKTLMQPV
jgi:hypothetical protein